LGGIVLATADRLVRVPAPQSWHCVLVHPDIALETRRARDALRGAYGLAEFVAQSANLALLLSGCHTGDAELIRAGLNDVLVEPRRAALIPGFHLVKQAALDHAALGASISGAGPSVFAWFESLDAATNAAESMRRGFGAVDIDSEAFVSPVNGPSANLTP
jgi:homoserine kinase